MFLPSSELDFASTPGEPPLGSQKLTSTNVKKGDLLWVRFSPFLYLVTEVSKDLRVYIRRVDFSWDESWVNLFPDLLDPWTFAFNAWVIR
jgi:hypothetical protein